MELKERRLAEDEAERYWRERATTLRTEIAAVDAEIAYVRARLDEGYAGFSPSWSSVSVSNFGLGFSLGNFGRWPFGNRGFGQRGWGNRVPVGAGHRRNIFVSPPTGAGLSGNVGFVGGAPRGRVFINSGVWLHGTTFGVQQFSGVWKRWRVKRRRSAF